MSEGPGTTVSASDLSTARSADSSGVGAKRGVELWLDDNANDDTSPPQRPSDSTPPPPLPLEGTAKPLNGLSVSPRASAKATSDKEAMDQQLRLLKEKRRQRAQSSEDSGAGSSMTGSARRPPSTTSSGGSVASVSPPPSARSGGSEGVAARNRVPPIDLKRTGDASKAPAASTTTTGSARGPTGKPPLSSRRQQVHLPRSGRAGPVTDSSSSGPMSARGAPPKLNASQIADHIKGLRSSDWKTVQSSLEVLRAVLTASDSPTDEVRVIMRQNLHGLVTGTLSAMDSPRSAVAKFATDLLGLVCQKLGTRHMQLDARPDSEEAAAVAVSGSTNSLEHFVSPIVTKVITKGGAASSRFLYDGAMTALRELIPATKPQTVVNALCAIPPLKTEKSKVLHGTGLSSSFEFLEPGSLRGKSETLSKVVHVADHYVHDAHPDVREAGKQLCRCLAQYCQDSREDLRALVRKKVGTAQPERAKETLAYCVVADGSAPVSARPDSTPSAAASARETTPSERESTRRSMPAADEPAAAPSSRGRPRSISPSAGGKDATRSPAMSAATSPQTRPPANLDSSALTRSPEALPSNDSFAGMEAQLPGRRELSTPPLVSPTSSSFAAASPARRPFSETFGLGAAASSGTGAWGEATQTNNTLFSNGSAVFSGTIAKDMQHEHGEFSKSIFAAAEGTSGDRLKALGTMATLLQRRLHDEDLSKLAIANSTSFALCDVVALRCADTSQKVQTAALELVPTLFKAVQSTVIDATSPRWVSCISTALSSSYEAVRGAAIAALKSLMQRCTEQNLRNMCQTICMTCSTVRNVNTKIELMRALELIMKRHAALVNRDMMSESGSASPLERSGANRTGLSRADIEFVTETGLRVWCSDPRDDVRRTSGQLLTTVLDIGWEGEEARILDNKRIDADSWAVLKALFDRHRAAQTSPTTAN